MGKRKETNAERMFMKNISAFVREKRLEKKKTQSFVADWLGVTFQQVQKYEKGSNSCPKWNELKLCELFGCDADYFVKPLIENNFKFLKRERNGYANSY